VDRSTSCGAHSPGIARRLGGRQHSGVTSLERQAVLSNLISCGIAAPMGILRTSGCALELSSEAFSNRPVVEIVAARVSVESAMRKTGS